MRGDFSRIRFNGRENYTAVLEQQGRVGLDADANEQRAIDIYRTDTQTIDVIGQYGGPVGDAGFQISVPDASHMMIGPGRYYVNGLLCENPGLLSYDSQPYLIAPGQTAAELIAALNAGAGASDLQLQLQVWQRLVTVLDDGCLREPALGQADTTARLQTVWRVVGNVVPVSQNGNTCCQGMYSLPGFASSTGTLTASTSGPAAECGCGPVAAAGYQGIENQLYRVEIHAGTDQAQPTFKWSRENGSVVTAITQVTGSTVTVSSLGPDANLGFQTGQWVELTDDTLEFGSVPNQPGTLHEIQSIQPADMSVTLAGGSPITVNPAQNARMRRWDQSGPAATSTGIPLSAGTTISLENGIEVTFGTGTFSSGDYWTIPARTATGQIEWPPCGSDGNPAQRPTSLVVYTAPLACVEWTPPTAPGGPSVEDCRRLFSPLTAIAPPAASQAIHVTGINWVNDDVVTLDVLISNGLSLTLDQEPTCPLTAANVIVTVESPSQVALGGGNGSPSAINLDTFTLVDSPVSVTGSAITWLMQARSQDQSNLIDDFNAIISQGASSRQWARMRIRIPGQLMYATGAAGTGYLDGQAFGQPGIRNDNVTPRIDLRLPSGTGAMASDFEGWLYVAPFQQVTNLTIDFPAVTVVPGSGDAVAFLEANVNGTVEQVSPTAQITMSYPVLADTNVSLGVFDTSGGQQNIVSVPPTVTIPNGQMFSNPVPIGVLLNPGPGTFNYMITAEADTQGPGNTVEASFAVTGAPQQTT